MRAAAGRKVSYVVASCKNSFGAKPINGSNGFPSDTIPILILLLFFLSTWKNDVFPRVYFQLKFTFYAFCFFAHPKLLLWLNMLKTLLLVFLFLMTERRGQSNLIGFLLVSALKFM